MASMFFPRRYKRRGDETGRCRLYRPQYAVEVQVDVKTLACVNVAHVDERIAHPLVANILSALPLVGRPVRPGIIEEPRIVPKELRASCRTAKIETEAVLS
jgi:hypothetical protein